MKNEIPKILNSYATGEPFTNCIDCDRYLLDDNVTYFIEKAMRQYNKEGYKAKDVLFEYAICMECADQIKGKMSSASREAMENYMVKNSSINHHDSGNLVCIIKGESIEQYDEYQVFSLCQGDNMITPNPMAIGVDALTELENLISSETKDELNRLMGDVFNPAPELEELLPNHRIPFLI